MYLNVLFCICKAVKSQFEIYKFNSKPKGKSSSLDKGWAGNWWFPVTRWRSSAPRPGPLGNGCTLVFVHETPNGTIIVCLHVFYDALVCQFKRIMYFCSVKHNGNRIMTALQLNAELFRELSITSRGWEHYAESRESLNIYPFNRPSPNLPLYGEAFLALFSPHRGGIRGVYLHLFNLFNFSTFNFSPFNLFNFSPFLHSWGIWFAFSRVL